MGLPRAFTGKFESWAAPFATGLLWLAEAALSVSLSRGGGAGAGGSTPGGGGGGGGGGGARAEVGVR